MFNLVKTPTLGSRYYQSSANTTWGICSLPNYNNPVNFFLFKKLKKWTVQLHRLWEAPARVSGRHFDYTVIRPANNNQLKTIK